MLVRPATGMEESVLPDPLPAPLEPDAAANAAAAEDPTTTVAGRLGCGTSQPPPKPPLLWPPPPPPPVARASAVAPSIIPASFVGGRASKASTKSCLSTQTPASKPTSARTCRKVFIGSLRNIARAAACSSVSVSHTVSFDGFLGLPRRLRGTSSASILAPAASAPAAVSSTFDDFLGRPPLLIGADVSPVHLQSTRTR